MAALTQRNSFSLHKAAPYIDWAIVALVFLSGLLHPSPKVFYDSAARIFLIITVPLFTFAFLIYRYSEKYGARIQGERSKTPPLAEEAFGSARAMFIVACMAAWPTAMYRIGMPTGIVWTIEEMGLNWWLVVLEMYAGIIAVDALTYWKHRLLHTKTFFSFHKHHHSFRDPTPFAGFAVGPLETVLTFFPLLFICFPPAKHFAPLYFSAIVGFVFLNLYLHCGVTYKWLEKILPRIGLNSSAWHNIHHSDVNANFGEVSFIWDKLCKTSRADYKRKRSAAIS
jgi:sterol desaturase/sphingolipid hydroxylase (fatty acid hydroxylase superfamily)